MSKAAETRQPKKGDFRKLLWQEAFRGLIPQRDVELMRGVMEKLDGKGGAAAGKRKRRRYGAKCGYVMEDGRKCKQGGWLGGEFCFQHDPEAAELRKLAGRPSKERLTKGQEVEELLDETLEELRAGRMKPGQAYATGYLAQLMLMARESRRKEVKLDVKWFWDMVDLVLAFDRAEKKLTEKKEQEAREQEEPQMNADERRSEEEGEEEEEDEAEGSEEEDDSGENGVIS